MARPKGTERSGRVAAVELPGDRLGDRSLLLGIQCRKEVEQVVAAGAGRASFTFDLQLFVEGDAIDLRGPFVHGRKGDRFLYLCWGRPGPAEPFVQHARAKLKFEDLPPGVLDQLLADDGLELVATVEATNPKGAEASGTLRPPAVTWELQPLGTD